MLFQEFDDKATSEDRDEEHADESPWTLEGDALLVERPQPEEDYEAEERLIDLRWMPPHWRYSVHTLEPERPRHICCPTDNLGVHEIADANAHARQRRYDRESIEQPDHRVALVLLVEQPQSRDDTQCATMTCQATLPHCDKIEGVLQHDFWFVEDHVTETSTKHCSCDHVDRQRVELWKILLLCEEDLLHHDKRQIKG